MKTILVTGGAGFIGSALIRFISREFTDYFVVNVDKLTYAGDLSSLIEIDKSRYAFEQVDICDAKSLNLLFRKYEPDYVMNLAAESHVDRSIDCPYEFIKTNIIGTYNMLEVTRDYLGQYPNANFRFLHVSTDEVYGDLKGSNDFFVESTAYAPSSPYSATKASSDHLVRAWSRTFNLPVLITNCSNNYGYYQNPEKLIPKTILNCLDGIKIPVYGDGKQIRDWLFVDDHVKAQMDVLFNASVGETYNIGGDNEVKNIDVVNYICEVLDDKSPLSSKKSYKELIEFVKDRPGHDGRYAIDFSKLKKDLNWSPSETFRSGIEKTVIWYLENKEWWESKMVRKE